MKKPHYVIPLIRKPKRKLFQSVSHAISCYLDFLMRILRLLELIPRRHNLFKSRPKNSPGSPHLADWSPWWPEAVPVHAAEWDNVPGFQPTIPGSNLDESYANLNKSTSILVDSPIIHWLFSTYELELGMHIQVDKPQKQPKPLGMVLLQMDIVGPIPIKQ